MVEFRELLGIVCDLEDGSLKNAVSKCDFAEIDEETAHEIGVKCANYIKFTDELNHSIMSYDDVLAKVNNCAAELYDLIFPFIKKELHDDWSQYSMADRIAINIHCKNCDFAGRAYIVDGIMFQSCSYLVRTGSVRRDRPEVCSHYKEKYTTRKQKLDY